VLVVTLDPAFVPQRTNSRTVMLSWVTLPWVAVEKEVQGREAAGADGEAGIVIIRHRMFDRHVLLSFFKFPLFIRIQLQLDTDALRKCGCMMFLTLLY